MISETTCWRVVFFAQKKWKDVVTQSLQHLSSLHHLTWRGCDQSELGWLWKKKKKKNENPTSKINSTSGTSHENCFTCHMSNPRPGGFRCPRVLQQLYPETQCHVHRSINLDVATHGVHSTVFVASIKHLQTRINMSSLGFFAIQNREVLCIAKCLVFSFPKWQTLVGPTAMGLKNIILHCPPSQVKGDSIHACRRGSFLLISATNFATSLDNTKPMPCLGSQLHC